MVIDNVEDDLDAGGVQTADHGLELTLHAFAADGSVPGIGREEAKCVVAPVIDATPFNEERIVDGVVDREEFQSGDTKFLEVIDAGGRGEAGVGAA